LKPQRSRSSYTISDKADFKPKLVRRDKVDHVTLIKEIIHHEYLTIVNICTLKAGTLNFIKQTLLNIKTQIDPNTIVVTLIPYSHQWICKLAKINKVTSKLNIINQMYLADM
jgi:hypothetical protein